MKRNIRIIINLWCLIIINVKSSVIPNDDYWAKRANMFRYEERLAFGNSLVLEDNERIANDVLMKFKGKEINEAFSDPAKFLPARNFIEARDDIEQSKVFKIIKMMPKGAVLHTHDITIVSEEYLYNNITHRDNLYVCDLNGTLSLRFFNEPTTDCDWQLLREIRSNARMADDINSRIRRQLSMITVDPDLVYPNINVAWDKFMAIYKFITPLLTYKPVFEDYFYQGFKEFYEDNIQYLELRSGLPQLYELDGTTYTPIEVLKIYEEVATRFINDYPDFCGVKLIYSSSRAITDPIDEFIESAIEMQSAFPNFFTGIDLDGQEDKRVTLKTWADKLYPFVDRIQTFFHASETNWYGMDPDENLIDAILLNATRIGHGYGVLKHPAVLQTMIEKDIPLEISPISNQVLKLVKDLRNHPASVLFANGFPVVISNDNPSLWGAKGLSYDFYEAFMGMMSRKADIRGLKQLAINSINYSTMNDDEKLRATEIWTLKWSNFIDKIVNDSNNN